MNPNIAKAIECARAVLNKRNTFVAGDEWYGVRDILLPVDWRNKRKGIRSYFVFASDDCGNAYLADENDVVLFWDHETDDIIPLSVSVIDFLDALIEPPEIKLKPEQVKRAWIDPEFLAAQKKK